MIGLKDQCFGVEVEMTGITREQAATALAAYFATDARYVGGAYDKWCVTDRDGKDEMPSRRCPVSAPVGRCVASWERGRVRIAPWQVERGFGPIFGAPKSGQEKAFGALLRHWPLRQPAVRTATEVCSTLKLTLITRRRICFGAISCKNSRLPRVCRAFGRL